MMIGFSEMKSVLVASVCFCVTWCHAADEGAPSVRPLSDEDFAAGIVLTKIGTGEDFDFSAPDGAEVCADWEAFGAARDWFRLAFGAEDDVDEYAPEGWSFAMGTNRVDSFTVFSYGTIRPSVTNVNTCVSPLSAVIGIVPVSNHCLLEAENRPSRFWHFLTPSNTLQLTWQNVLLDRDVFKPVSFQAEIDTFGNITFRYDLSRLPDETIVNLSAGVLNEGRGRMFSYLSRDITSMRWRYLNPSLPSVPDHDGDGISTSDELFVYDTDPYSADTDRDGLSDYEEVAVANTNPNARYSSDPRVPDSVASALDGTDPYSCPNGDGRSAFENVFYTGSPSGRGGEPVSSLSTAVLKVSVSGSGRGILFVGDVAVPLLDGIRPLKVAVPRKTLVMLSKEIEGELHLNFDSDDFGIGALPLFGDSSGWILFPNVKATHPCVHDDTREVTVALDPGADVDEIEGLTCKWNSTGTDVTVTARSPLSAVLGMNFPRNSTASVNYEISHPKYLFGKTTFRQVCEHCPKIEDEDEYSSTMDYMDLYGDNGFVDDQFLCPTHGCPFLSCWNYHIWTRPVGCPEDEIVSNAYEKAATCTNEYIHVLKLHRPYSIDENRDVRLIDVFVPPDKVKCCQCEEHWASYASIGTKSHHVAVHLGDEPFVRTTEDCTLKVYGVSPSEAIGDSRVSINTNGAFYVGFDYTVLGVSILGDGVDLRKLNSLNSKFGMPVVINTNLERAVNIKLCTDVNLPDGTVRLAFDKATTRMQLWMTYTVGDYFGHEKHIKLLDTETCPEFELPIEDWKRFVKGATFNRETTLQLLAFGRGSAQLFFGYAGCKDGKYLHDEAVQTITAIRPPLLPDYNRDGKIDDADAFDYSNGRIKYFWANQDTWKGDNAFDASLIEGNNSEDFVINGRNDLINFLPIAVDVANFVSNWNSQVVYKIETKSQVLQCAKLAFADIDYSRVGDMPLGNDLDVNGNAIYEAAVTSLGEGISLQRQFLLRSYNGHSTLLAEFPEFARNEIVYLNIYSAEKVMLFSSPLVLHIGDVENMIGWVNLRSVAGGSDGLPTRLVTKDWPESDHGSGSLVFVHGYNMAEDKEAPFWAKNVFKKMWWAGLNRGLIAVQWRGNEGQIYVPGVGFATPDYYGNVQNAFQTASALSEVMNSIKGSKWFLAHSLGNMMVSAAIQDYAMTYEKYFMLNAAIAMEAFDPVAGITTASHDKMTPEVWIKFVDRVRSTHWFECFPEGDGRRLLTWKGRFANVTNIVNFYSSQEEVVNNGDSRRHPIFERNYVWYNQETRKGEWPLMLHEYEGGWAFNPFYENKLGEYDAFGKYQEDNQKKSPSDVAKLTDAQLRQNPFFLDFYNPEMHTSPNGQIVANDYLYRAEMLAYAIPSESFAVGANPLPQLNAQTNQVSYEVKPSGNYNMATLFAYGLTDLPENGQKTTDKHRDWQHSTFVQRSYKRTHQLFQTIVNFIK